MVVDCNRKPWAVLAFPTEEAAKAEVELLNSNEAISKYAPFRVVRDVVLEDLEEDGE